MKKLTILQLINVINEIKSEHEIDLCQAVKDKENKSYITIMKSRIRLFKKLLKELNEEL